MVSSSDADWTREVPRKFWDPSRKLLKSLRDYQKLKLKRGLLAWYLLKLCVLRHLFWSAVTGADIPLHSNLGGGLLLPHPNGIVIHPDAVVGVNCLVHQQVTIGVKRGDSNAPVIAGHVDIGAGAKIIGGIVIGEHALIGANSVVVKNIDSLAIVAGVPAKVIGKTNV